MQIPSFHRRIWGRLGGGVIELDGSVHDEETQQESDTKRDEALNELGLRIIHFGNEDILKNLASPVINGKQG
jgi:very-short-patch-repair endonuclease